MTGGWVSEYPEDVKAIKAAGHDLGNHSETHKNMSQLSKEEQKEELMKVHEKVKELTGVEMELFRPPYGDYDDQVILTAKECGYYPIQWDVDSLELEKLRNRQRDPDHFGTQKPAERFHYSLSQRSKIYSGCTGIGDPRTERKRI